MLKVGLTGGLACGKSFVATALAGYGCFLIRADELGHAVLEPGGPAFEPVVREFGRGILDQKGWIDRRLLAARVFEDPQALARLNALVHPAVFQQEERLLAEFAARDPKGIAVVEAAILIETGHHKNFDRVILVACTVEQQIARAMHRDGVAEAEVRVRLSRQMPLEDKRKYADFVIDTSGAKEETLRQTRAIYETLRRIEQ